jgi:hypothetical protein
MIRSAPSASRTEHPYSRNGYVNLGNLNLLQIKPGVEPEEALMLASEYLNCAAATACETADNTVLAFRPVARSVAHQIKAAQALVEGALERMAADRIGVGLD